MTCVSIMSFKLHRKITSYRRSLILHHTRTQILKSMYETMMNDEWQIKKRKLDMLRKKFLRSRQHQRHHRSISMRSAPKKPKPKKKKKPAWDNKELRKDPKMLWEKVRHLIPEIADAGIRARFRPPWIKGGGYQRPYPTQDEQ